MGWDGWYGGLVLMGWRIGVRGESEVIWGIGEMRLWGGV